MVVLIVVRGHHKGDGHVQVRIGDLLEPRGQRVGVLLGVVQAIEAGWVLRGGGSLQGTSRCWRSGRAGCPGGGSVSGPRGASTGCRRGLGRRRRGRRRGGAGAWPQGGAAAPGGAVVGRASLPVWEAASRIAGRCAAHMGVGAMRRRPIGLGLLLLRQDLGLMVLLGLRLWICRA